MARINFHASLVIPSCNASAAAVRIKHNTKTSDHFLGFPPRGTLKIIRRDRMCREISPLSRPSTLPSVPPHFDLRNPTKVLVSLARFEISVCVAEEDPLHFQRGNYQEQHQTDFSVAGLVLSEVEWLARNDICKTRTHSLLVIARSPSGQRGNLSGRKSEIASLCSQ